MLCICGSELDSNKCCRTIVNGENKAQTPVALMRSRYFAFAHSLADYLVASHSKLTRVPELNQELVAWCSVTKWTKLTVHTYSQENLEESIKQFRHTSTTEQLPTVCFSAFYFYKNEFYMMTEKSRFIIEDGQWRYLDGESVEHVNFGKLGLNQPCPCNSGKKFKRCCKRTH